MIKIELEIVAITHSQSQSGAFVLILGEIEGKRKLPILIGEFEAFAIALEIQKEKKPPRPLTHDLMKNIIKTFNIKLNEVIIHDFQEGTYYAMLILEKDNKIYQVDSRPSDAVALALRFNCPIYTTPKILDETGFILSEAEEKLFSEEVSENTSADENEPPLHLFTLEELEKMLEEAVQNEDYELASKIRDEIKRKKAK